MTKKTDVAKVVLHEGSIYDASVKPSRANIPPSLVWKWMPQMTPPCWGFAQASEEEKIANMPQWLKEKACENAAKAKKDMINKAHDEALSTMFDVEIPTEITYTVEVPK